MNGVEAQAVRQAIIAALPANTSLQGQTPDARHVYVPRSHIKALSLENDLVIGGRGVGKSFWAAALRDMKIRSMLGEALPDLPKTDVQSGFAEAPDIGRYPDAETFSQVMGADNDAYSVWRTVVGRWAEKIVANDVINSNGSWLEAVGWVKSNPEPYTRLLEAANQKLANGGRHGLIVFDALDRLSSNWTAMDSIVRELLRVVLMLKSVNRIHAKVFLREDQYDNRTVTNFTDASKIQSEKVELTWAPHDLHGLLWQYLLNADQPHGGLLRDIYERTARESLMRAANGVWSLSERAKREGNLQKELFTELAGEYMGRDRRRGFTYTWSVGHLADARRRTLPRSFLAGVRAAAEHSHERYPEHSFPLHYESIKIGVQKASEIRVNELAEDYPWVRKLLGPLHGLTVPCEASLVDGKWLLELGETPQLSNLGRLPPEHSGDGWAGIRRDLARLGIFEPMKDGRVNMPELYRVGFGLGRKGGVKPMTNKISE